MDTNMEVDAPSSSGVHSQRNGGGHKPGPSGAYQTTNSYLVSAQKPTVIQAAVVGNYRRADELDLIIARVNRLEHLLVTAEGLRPHREIPIFGRIASLISFRLPGESLDSVVVLTVKYHLAILSFDSEGNVRTRASGNVADPVGRQADTGIIATVHSSGLIALRLYDGHLKLIEWKDDKDLRPFNIRFEDLGVTDIAFLNTPIGSPPTVAYYYDEENSRHMAVCEIDMEEKSFMPASWRQGNIETETSLLIPVPQPYGGVILVGKDTISYQKSGNVCIAIAPPTLYRSEFSCYGIIDKTGERFLLGDMAGRLFMLLLLTDPGTCEIKNLKLEQLGETSIPECLVYLDNSVAFIGSRFGDSQLIRLATEPIEVDAQSTSFVQVLDTYPNLGPIRDLVCIRGDGERQTNLNPSKIEDLLTMEDGQASQTQVVTCSGAYKDGSLRVIRSGIGIDVLASVELVGVKAVFTMHSPVKPGIDKYVVISFADVTHLLLMDGEEMEDIELANFDLAQATLWAGNVAGRHMAQVTPTHIHLLNDDGTFHQSWESPTRLSLCSVNPHSGQMIVASASEICYLTVEGSEIMQKANLIVANEVACLDISPMVEGTASMAFAVGMWNSHAVALYSIEPEMQLVTEEKIGGEVLPRSLLIVSMESSVYLLVALGDGTLYYYRVNQANGSLSEQKKVTLGTQPISLRRFQSKGQTNVFVCSDRPAVIYSSNHKLAFSNVNMKQVNQVSPLNSVFYRDCLMMSDGANLLIGTIDEIQKLHIRKIPLGECVSRIAYQPETGTLAVLTYRTEEVLPNGENYSRPSVSTLCASRTTQSLHSPGATPPTQSHDHPMLGTQSNCGVHSICIFDSNTFEPLHVYELNRNEMGISVCSAKLANDPTPYYAVGTSYYEPEMLESKLGRVLVFQTANAGNLSSSVQPVVEGRPSSTTVEGFTGGQKLHLVCEKEVKGCVFSITTLNEKLICTVNGAVRLFEWTAEKELRLECSHFNYTTALYLRTKGDLVLVADLMRSICLLSYKQADSSFEELARDYSTEWTTACEIVDSDTFIAAENCYNLFCCQRDASAEVDTDRARLKAVGFFYLGEVVNVFRRGSLASHHAALSMNLLSYTNPIVYGTVDGGLGVIVQLSDSVCCFLRDLQKRVSAHTSNCMRIDHSTYRNYLTEKRHERWQGFIDGDLVETLLDMPKEEVMKLVEGMHVPERFQPAGSAGGGSLPPQQQQEKSTIVESVLKLVEELSRLH